MSYKVDNAIIMAAGFASRFTPISYEKPKGLVTVKNEVLIERLILQLKAAGIPEIVVVVGYKKEQFYYLKEKFGVIIIENTEYETRNNHSSLYVARDYLKSSYICCSDEYFIENPFRNVEDGAFLSVEYLQGEIVEWAATINDEEVVTNLSMGAKDQWIMYGNVFYDSDFSKKYLEILNDIYHLEETKPKYFEEIYSDHVGLLKMKANKRESGNIFEFDSLEDLREFDKQYLVNSGSIVMQFISEQLKCTEGKIVELHPLANNIGMQFEVAETAYKYIYESKEIIRL